MFAVKIFNNIESGKVINFGAKEFGFSQCANGGQCFFHRSQYRGALKGEALRARLDRLAQSPAGQEIFLIVGPGPRPGQKAALAWGFKDQYGDNSALIQWRANQERRLVAC